MKAIILYATYSGNTEEVAELIEETLLKHSVDVKSLEITENSKPVKLEEYDNIFFGTFTWDRGGTPDFVKDYVYKIGYKPKNVAVFGTGDTQFGGDDIYCGAVKKLAKFYKSKWEPLLIEQSPRGSQEEKVVEWTERVIKNT